MAEHRSLGNKDWWKMQIGKRNNGALVEPIFDITEKGASYDDILFVTKRNSMSHTISKSITMKPEEYLTKCFLDIGLFDKHRIEEDFPVRLGQHEGEIDVLARADDGSVWVIELKIVEGKNRQGKRIPIEASAVGQAIGQSLLYSWLIYTSKKRSLRGRVIPDIIQGIMPAICTWELGSGKDDVISLCKYLGVTVINLTDPGSVKIYFLDDDNPRLFVSSKKENMS